MAYETLPLVWDSPGVEAARKRSGRSYGPEDTPAAQRLELVGDALEALERVYGSLEAALNERRDFTDAWFREVRITLTDVLIWATALVERLRAVVQPGWPELPPAVCDSYVVKLQRLQDDPRITVIRELRNVAVHQRPLRVIVRWSEATGARTVYLDGVFLEALDRKLLRKAHKRWKDGTPVAEGDIDVGQLRRDINVLGLST